MKIIFSVALLVLQSGLAFADFSIPTGRYSGFGKVELPDGKVIPFLLTSKIESSENDSNLKVITDNYRFPKGIKYTNIYGVKLENSKLTIYRDGNVSGLGQCNGTTCGYGFSFSDTGVYGTESISFHQIGIKRSGIRFVEGKKQKVQIKLLKVD